jgi:hypothetical protein
MALFSAICFLMHQQNEKCMTREEIYNNNNNNSNSKVRYYITMLEIHVDVSSTECDTCPHSNTQIDKRIAMKT